MIEKILEKFRAKSDEWLDIFEKSNYWDAYADGMCDAFDEAIQIVQEVAKEYGNGWIPCSERLPNTDENRKYLVCGKNGGIYIAEFVCKAYSNNTSIGPWWSASGRYAPEPIAWQPLPAPYGKDTNVPSRCDTCTHNVADEVPPICYMCSKGIEDNYERKGE